MTDIVLLRHGQTEWDRQNRLHGHVPVPLTETGYDSVTAIGRRLASQYDFDRMYAADTMAARETAALVRLTGLGPRPQFEAAWRPRDAGVFQGLAYDELGDGMTDDLDTDVDVLQPLPRGGEPLADGRARVLDRWERLCERSNADEQVLVVTHDFPMATILADIDDAGSVADLGRYAPGKCSMTTVRRTVAETTIGESDTQIGQFANG
ncbi:fructose-2,6-bisphosphatase [Halogeometricum borinquense DSM 11551]|nr:histidine phosphatase family protein [Halogeometricum borinquense]ELY29417.1 fructose-2,6-bisphosphatase [Halogeometricum borinquense DSM 11551]